MNIRRLNKSNILVENMQIHEYLTDEPQIGRRDYRVYPPRYADPYYVLPPPGNHRGNILGMGRGRGRRGLMGDDSEDVHAMRRCHMTHLAQMEEAERQFKRRQAAENRERQLTRNNKGDSEDMTPEIGLETVGEPVEANIVRPRSPRPEPTPESRSRIPKTSSHCPDEERTEISIPHSRPSLRANVTSEGVREVTTSEDRVVPPTSTTPGSMAQDVPTTTWTSLSDHERILKRTRE